MPRHRVFRLALEALLHATLVVGCQAQLVPKDRPWVHENEATGTVSYKSGELKLISETFYIVDIGQLEKLGGALTYLGSEREYHLMRVWRKFVTDPDEITRFAVRHGECDVHSAQERAKEFEEHGASNRKVVWLDGHCTVPPRP